MNTIFPFSSSEIPSLEQAGGKALALMQMTHAGMPVPPGFVLTVKFFEPWMDSLKQSPEWAAITKADADKIGQAAKALQGLCRELHFTREQKDELDNALNAFHKKNNGHLYAVRSSSPEEDLEGASFAGGYETTLGVTIYKIDVAILHSFMSSVDERVFLYKKEHGFRIDQPRIAVVIQQQVDAERAGVAFSINPLNNCYDEAVINANYGLGESVVSGESEPDVFVVDKVKHKIIEEHIGRKQTIIVLDPEGGTYKETIVDSPQVCLTHSQALDVTCLVEQVEKYYQKPMDIEWAFSGGKLFLLQARPITTYLPLPEEMITAPGAPKQLYADATLIEQGLQEPMSVLGADFLAYVLREMTGLVGGDVIGIDGIAFTSGGRYYLQLSNSIKLMGTNSPLAPGSMGDTSVMEILANLDIKQYTPRNLPKKLRTTKSSILLRMPMLIMSSLKTFRDPDAFMRKYMETYPRQLQRLDEIMKQELTLHELAVKLNSIVHFFSVDYGVPMFMIPQFVELRLKQIFKKESERVKDDLVSLGISLPGNKPAEMGQLLYKLASFEEFIYSSSAAEFTLRLQKGTLDPAFLKIWNQFMDEFGFRCPGEIDVAIARPNEKSELLYEQLKDMAEAITARKGTRTIFEEAKAKREAAYKSLKELAFKKGKIAGKAFEACYRVLLSFGGHGKETSKHHIVMVMDAFRKRALQVAHTFVKAGRLDDPDQIFNLTIDDIDRAVKDPALDLRALAKERTVLLNRIKQIHLVARVIDSRGKVFSPPRKEAKQGELTGVPISPGIVQGKVKVLHQVDEKKLLPGEILVARSTDPGWTPLFIHAGGIILEIGGALQHGAIIAREYGIPCVSGLDDATSLLTDGQLVEVDGSNGIVRILE